jgi:hypothetical protein
MCVPQLLALSRIRHTVPPLSEALGVAVVHHTHGSKILYAAWGLFQWLDREVQQRTQALLVVP